ncbi:MAG: serine/threonine-protein kinase [Chloroflexota bacterium]
MQPSTILDAGTILRNRYEILELVGQGGQGAVYKSTDHRLEGRICAIKETLPLLSAYQGNGLLEQVAEQFRKEASVLARLDHPNLPKVSDHFSIDEREYLVMDYVLGKDMLDIIRETKRENRFLDEQKVLGWADQLLDALQYLHSQDPPVIHRDIKPANIKVTAQDIVKLVDFGLVKELQSDDIRTVTVVQGRGTVAYTPLEQYGSDSFTDTRTDIYSVGATLYHLLVGEPPADAKERFLHPKALKPIRELNPQVSPSVANTIFMALNMQPDDRPDTVNELRELLGGTQLPSVITSPSSKLRQTPWNVVFRKNLSLVGTALTLLFIAGVISFYELNFWAFLGF